MDDTTTPEGRTEIAIRLAVALTVEQEPTASDLPGFDAGEPTVELVAAVNAALGSARVAALLIDMTAGGERRDLVMAIARVDATGAFVAPECVIHIVPELGSQLAEALDRIERTYGSPATAPAA